MHCARQFLKIFVFPKFKKISSNFISINYSDCKKKNKNLVSILTTIIAQCLLASFAKMHRLRNLNNIIKNFKEKNDQQSKAIYQLYTNYLKIKGSAKSGITLQYTISNNLI